MIFFLPEFYSWLNIDQIFHKTHKRFNPRMTWTKYSIFWSAIHEVKSDYYSDSFFQSTRSDQKDLQKFYKILWSQITSFGLANWTKKGFPLFPRNIPYREILKSPPFSFIRHCETFFRKKTFKFLMFGDRMDVFEKKNSPSVPFSVFWCFATMDSKKKSKRCPF